MKKNGLSIFLIFLSLYMAWNHFHQVECNGTLGEAKGYYNRCLTTDEINILMNGGEVKE